MKTDNETIKQAKRKRDLLRPLLVRMTEEEIDRLLDVLPMDQIGLPSPPVTGLIMAKARDCFDAEFYLGEVLTTRSEVVYKKHRAQATILGHDPKRSLVAAVLDVMARSGRLDVLQDAVEISEPAMARLRQDSQTVSLLTAATRVQFETMAKEV